MRKVTAEVLVVVLVSVRVKFAQKLSRAQSVKKLRKDKFRKKLLWFLSVVTVF